MAELLPRERVREMQLDEGQFHAQQGVAQRDAGVRESAGIDDGERNAVRLRGLHAVDELVLRVALEGHELVAELRGRVFRAFFDRGEGVRAVNVRLSLPQE